MSSQAFDAASADAPRADRPGVFAGPVAVCLAIAACLVFVATPMAVAETPDPATPDTVSEADPGPKTDSISEADPSSEEDIASETESGSEEDTVSETDAADDPSRPTVVLGSIDADIGLAESAYLVRLLEEADTVSADLVILRLNTFGGRVDAAVAMRDAMLDASQKTVVFIDKRAISAGALISLAADVIVMTAGGTIGAATPVQSAPGQELPEAVEEKYLSYFREEMRSTAEAKGRDPDLAEAMVDASVEVADVSEEGKLLTLGTRRALELGLIDLEAESLDEIYSWLEIEPTIAGSVDRSWSEDLVAFLTSAPVVSLLALGMFLLGYLELQTPGVGVFGAGALVCALLLYFSHSLVNLAGSEELIFFGIGVVLMLVEMLVLPGFGIAGFLGLASIGTSLVLLLLAGDWSDVRFDNPFTMDAVERVGWVFLLSLGLMALLIRWMPQRKIAGITLASPLSTEEGYASHRDPEPGLLGVRGVALTALRPTGKARLDGRRVDVEAVGEWIDKGAPVEVTRQVEGRVVVRLVEPEEAQEG
ncbi:MAG: NfeD family protein [Acidobacteriota bacterium]